MRRAAVSFSSVPIIPAKPLAHARRCAGGKLKLPEDRAVHQKEARGSGLTGNGGVPFPEVPQFEVHSWVRAGTVVSCSSQIGRDRYDRYDRDRGHEGATVGIGPGGVTVGPRQRCRGDYHGRVTIISGRVADISDWPTPS